MDVPKEAYAKSKWAIADVIAATFAGFQHEVGKGIISLVKEFGGNPVATILGDGHQTSVPWAAYANGTLAHAIDYDDINNNIGGHPTAPVFSALLAAGEKAGASGKEFLLSYVTGVEAECKVGKAINKVHYHLGWHPTATLGTLGATAACAKILKLNRNQVIMALGIAGSQASGLKQNFGTMTKPLHVGQAAKNGTLSALLASRGWTADREILEGHFGFCNLYASRGSYDLKDMTENLGKPFDVVEPGIQLKKYPCCGSTHPTLDALLRLKKEHPSPPEKVERVECVVDPSRIHILVHPNPQTGLEGKFSLEYCIAAAILKGKTSLVDFQDDRVKEKNIQSLLPKIQIIRQPSPSPFSVKLKIILQDGKALETTGDRSPGITSWEDLSEKYKDCLAGTLPSQQIQQSLEMIQDLEKVKNISEVIKTLVMLPK